MSSGYEPARHGYRYRCDENVRIRMRLRCDRKTQRDFQQEASGTKAYHFHQFAVLVFGLNVQIFSLIHSHRDTVASWPDASSHRSLSKSLCL